MNSTGSIQRKAKMDEIEELPSTSRRCFDDIKVQFGNFKVKQSGRRFLAQSAWVTFKVLSRWISIWQLLSANFVIIPQPGSHFRDNFKLKNKRAAFCLSSNSKLQISGRVQRRDSARIVRNCCQGNCFSKCRVGRFRSGELSSCLHFFGGVRAAIPESSVFLPPCRMKNVLSVISPRHACRMSRLILISRVVWSATNLCRLWRCVHPCGVWRPVAVSS